MQADRASQENAGGRTFFRSRAGITIVLLYALQLFFVCYWRVVPLDRRDHKGVTYSIHRGDGNWSEFIPALPMVLSFDSVYVLRKVAQTGETSIHHYDILGNAYLDHEEVWPEK